MTKTEDIILTEKEQLFCEQYLKLGSASQAAKIAGYSSPRQNSTRIMKQKKIKAYLAPHLEKLQKKMEKKIAVTFEAKLNKLWEIVQDASNTDEKGVTKTDYKARISAIAELNKMQGHHSPATTVNVDVKDDRDLQVVRRIAEQNRKEY